jgi:predicted nucleotidyltransferase
MRKINNISLASNQQRALNELKYKLTHEFDIESLALYGSAARGEAREDSDLDLLILTKHPLTRSARHKITDLAFEINLHYGTNLSTVVVDHESWEKGAFSVSPFREEVLRDGVYL